LRFMQPLLVATLSLSGAQVAHADTLWFHSPSGNIQCMIGSFTNSQMAECHISEATPSFTTRPENCGGDWGNRFFVMQDGVGERSCWTDLYFLPENSVTLPYGGSITFKAVTCASDATGMTCRNTDGGGFFLSRSAQRVF